MLKIRNEVIRENNRSNTLGISSLSKYVPYEIKITPEMLKVGNEVIRGNSRSNTMNYGKNGK
jgi:hypothetical protein